MRSERRARSRIPSRGAIVAALLVCPVATLGAQPAPPRAIVASFDALNRDRALRTVSPDAIPALRRLLLQGSCATGARPMFPSQTAPGHAALWTGAWGSVNGVSANDAAPLPRGEHTVAQVQSGYGAPMLRAEPLWIAAARQGVPTVAHHVTQAPGMPGRRRADGSVDDTARARDAAVLAGPGLLVLNGYNRGLADWRVLVDSVPKEWAGGAAARWDGVTGRELSVAAGEDSLHLLLVGGATPHLLANRRRSAAGAVRADLAPPDDASPRARPLARRFSAPLAFPVAGGVAHAWFRLVALAPDLARFRVLVSEINVVEANDPVARAAYDSAVGGFAGNGASRALADGKLGVPIPRGGDGTAELLYLETMELVVRQAMRGTEWGWRTRRPRLQLEYLPYPDETDHLWYGFIAAPGVERLVRSRIAAMRDRAWSIIDLRMAQLEHLAREGGAAVFAGSDHGMRATWGRFQVNAALRAAGLLALDSANRVDLARTRAYSPNSYWVSVNTVDRKGGIVPLDEHPLVLAEVERALRAVRDSGGVPVVTRTWAATATDTLGIGGPTGGDLYFGLAEGWYMGRRLTGPVLEAEAPMGSHGFPSIEPDMWATFCAQGPGFAPRLIGPVRLTDMAPTVSEWLGITPPAEATGSSRLGVLR